MSFISSIYQNTLENVMKTSLSVNGSGAQNLPGELQQLANLEQYMSPQELMQARSGALQDLNRDLAQDKQRTLKGKAPQYITSLQP
jgi:hypothetical protein